ncbi:MAG: MlaD family protein [Bacteroidales bacterium]|jgi:phospholipid/cholesterol/gamma-HCH transport system substrate-binding protein|nr:MlaD family protein [Bacteroidales bacterium]MDY0053698.1 MlaD family protein [Bacteroidales bacterium]
MKIKTEYKVGIVGVITIAILYFGISFMKGRDLFKVETSYYVVFDNVEGLYKSNYVYLNGMKVGYIKDINNIDAFGESFLVHISIKSDIKIPNNSEIMIFNSDLLGSKALKIVPGNSTIAYNSKDTIPSVTETGLIDQLSQDITPIIGRLNRVITSLDTLLLNVNSIMDKETQNDIKQSIANINSATANIDNISLKLDGLMESEKQRITNIFANAESITKNLRDNNAKLTNAIENFNNISDTIAQAKLGSTIRETNQSLSSLSNILKSIEKGEGSAGLLIKDDKLYNNLEKSSKELEALIEDIKTNPKKYLTIKVF